MPMPTASIEALADPVTSRPLPSAETGAMNANAEMTAPPPSARRRTPRA